MTQTEINKLVEAEGKEGITEFFTCLSKRLQVVKNNAILKIVLLNLLLLLAVILLVNNDNNIYLENLKIINNIIAYFVSLFYLIMIHFTLNNYFNIKLVISVLDSYKKDLSKSDSKQEIKKVIKNTLRVIKKLPTTSKDFTSVDFLSTKDIEVII